MTSTSSSSEITAADKNFMMMSKKSSNMSLPLTITSPQTTISYSQSTTATNADATTPTYYEEFHRKVKKEQNLHTTMSFDGSSKKRRSASSDADAENAACQSFTEDSGDRERQFTSPGWPNNYTKEVNCVKRIEGE